jgi:hypothetical protein
MCSAPLLEDTPSPVDILISPPVRAVVNPEVPENKPASPLLPLPTLKTT